VPRNPLELRNSGPTRERFEALLGWAASEEAGVLEHSEFEERLASDGREMLRGGL
jgi:hypothetical protein